MKRTKSVLIFSTKVKKSSKTLPGGKNFDIKPLDIIKNVISPKTRYYDADLKFTHEENS